MNVFALAGLSVGLSCLILTFITFLFGKTKLHRLLLFFNLAVACWGAGLFLVGIANSESTALFAWKIAQVGGFFVAPIFFQMMSIFCDIQRRKLINFAYVQAIFFVTLTIFTKHVSNDIRIAFDLYFIEASLLYTIAILFYLFFVGLSFYELIIFLGKATGHRRTQALYNIVGFLFGFTGGTSTFLPMFHIDTFLPYGNFGITIYAFIITYAILRHNLMDINLVFKRTIVYSLSAGLVTSVFVVLVLGITKLFSTLLAADSFTVTVIAALIIAFIFNPLKTKIESFFDKFFYKAKVNYSLIMKEASTKLAELVKPTNIRKFVCNTIFNSLQLRCACVLTVQGDYFQPVYSKFHREKSEIPEPNFPNNSMCSGRKI